MGVHRALCPSVTKEASGTRDGGLQTRSVPGGRDARQTPNSYALEEGTGFRPHLLFRLPDGGLGTDNIKLIAQRYFPSAPVLQGVDKACRGLRPCPLVFKSVPPLPVLVI